jgi:hypothetical protein
MSSFGTSGIICLLKWANIIQYSKSLFDPLLASQETGHVYKQEPIDI